MVNVRPAAPPGGPLTVRAWGRLACFTRPELASERVSYPVMTPTAAVGLLESIFWKPEFRWRVVAIDVLRPVTWLQLRRNEVSKRQTARIARSWAEGNPEGFEGYDAAHNRAQRATLALLDVAYVIHAHPVPRAGVDAPAAKYRDQFRRRVARGQYHEHPYLGCREMLADFSDALPADAPIEWDEDLGPMIHHVYAGADAPSEVGYADPIYFDAKVRGGRLSVPRLPAGRR